VNRTEVAALLTWVSAIDNRVVSREAVIAWSEILPPFVTLEDGKAAAQAHFRDRPGEYLMPAHIVAGVRGIRAARLAAHPDPLPDVDPDDVEAYQARRRELRTALASPGRHPEITR
jgi:hypothetical protein